MVNSPMIVEWLGSLTDLLLNLCAQFFVLSFHPTIGSAVYLPAQKDDHFFLQSLNLVLTFDLYNHMRSLQNLAFMYISSS